jgi:predicted DNA-binding transcriptional regulator YafY
MAAAQLKVLAALPPELRSRASRLVERFHLDVTGWFQTAEEAPLLAVLSQAVWESRPVDVTYDRGDRLVERRLRPLGLVLKAGTWYLAAEADGQVRTYRAARVKQALVADERFERDTDFDLAAFWAESTAAYERAIERLEVTLRVDEEALGPLVELAGVAAVRAAERLTPPEGDPDGTQVLRLLMDWPHEVPARLLALGDHADVLEPPELRAQVASLAQRLAAHYATPEPT